MYIYVLPFFIAVCRAGYYSRRKRYQSSGVAMEPCITCDIGFYQPNYGQTQCLPCPSNTTTEKRGSTDVGHCLPFYDKEIDDCRVDLCLNGGQCLQSENDFLCACQEYYVGKMQSSNSKLMSDFHLHIVIYFISM